jgi:hypothetical protein
MGGMTTTIRGLAIGTVLAGCAIGLAGPASAELADGTYQMTYLVDPGPPETLVVTSCGEGCKTVQMIGYQAAEYRLQGSTWIASDGSPKTIDDNTLAGSANTWAYQLTKVG